MYVWLDPGSRAHEANLGWLAYTAWLVVPICLLAGTAWVFPFRGARVIGSLMLAAGLLSIVSGLKNLLTGGIADQTTAGDFALGVGVLVALLAGGVLFVRSASAGGDRPHRRQWPRPLAGHH